MAKRSASAIATERTASPWSEAGSERRRRAGPGANATTSYVPSSRVVDESIGGSAGAGSAGIPGKDTDSRGPESVTRIPPTPRPPRVTRPDTTTSRNAISSVVVWPSRRETAAVATGLSVGNDAAWRGPRPGVNAST
jgi:hypothetical protein